MGGPKQRIKGSQKRPPLFLPPNKIYLSLAVSTVVSVILGLRTAKLVCSASKAVFASEHLVQSGEVNRIKKSPNFCLALSRDDMVIG